MAIPEEIDELGGSTALTGKLDLDDPQLRAGHLQMVVLGHGTFATHPLPDEASLTLGRSSQADIKIEDVSISRRHARLRIGDVLTIEDLGSANGTFVRGTQLAVGKPCEIAVGEVVRLGEANVILQKRSRTVRSRRLWTHDYFEARFDEECARARRSGVEFALLHIYSKNASSESFVEETLAELVRESDVLGKYGPHKYEVLLTNTPVARGSEAVRRIQAKLVDRGLDCELFLACCPRDGSSVYQLSAHVHQQANKEARPTPLSIGTSDIIVADPQMESLHRMLALIAASQINVLLLGETGVGKEVFARAVHQASPRASGPFVELNCAALTDSLLESELFGHEKGAFTNAVAAKPGLIETADGGTLFLDEIGEMPMSTQAKLLRVIENSELRRVGGVKVKSVDVRFVAATNRDLEAQIEANAFRRDLFFRLNAVTLVIPPLRERPAELELLARMFITRASGTSAPPELSEAALEMMRGYSWPGNIRELKNVIDRAVLLADGGPIRPEHLPGEKMRATLMTDTTQPLPRGHGSEQQRIMQALERAGGNQTQAARLLGISRRTLVNRLNDYKEIHRPRKHERDKK